MKKLQFTTIEEFKQLFKSKNEEVSDAIVQGIQIAKAAGKKSAGLFEISLQDEETVFEISLNRAQWVTALESCLTNYELIQESDKAIDTYLLIKQIKKQQDD